MAFGLLWIAKNARQDEVVIVRYDGEYARNMAGGLWKPRANRKAVSNAKSACSLAEAQCTLQWVHVDSHTGDELKGRAGGLAALGGNDWTSRTQAGETTVPRLESPGLQPCTETGFM